MNQRDKDEGYAADVDIQMLILCTLITLLMVGVIGYCVLALYDVVAGWWR